ncbi:hypothetical protein [Bacillus toyonensis]|uniref:hypothetical protein n=1 Tax=Bacillus toyonensis TaxID=155322 RepID=UPI00159B8A3D|nr:hypothetical protein [Bacillus toyonensis]
MDNPNKDKTCFIITPIGDDQSDIRRATDGVIDAVIIPALIEIGFKRENIDVAHRMSNSGSINRQVITSVLECDLAIANLSNLNPNVMYELAIRHAVRKPVVQICQKGTKLPFDITEERTIFYNDDMKGVIELQIDFKNAVTQAMNNKEPDNPIYRVVESNTIMKSVDENDPSKFLLNRMNSLENNLSDLINSLNNKFQTEFTGSSDRFDKDVIKNYMVTVKIDKGKINPREFHDMLKQYEIQNPDVYFDASFLGDMVKIKVNAQSIFIREKAVEFILGNEFIA